MSSHFGETVNFVDVIRTSFWLRFERFELITCNDKRRRKIDKYEKKLNNLMSSALMWYLNQEKNVITRQALFLFFNIF